MQSKLMWKKFSWPLNGYLTLYFSHDCCKIRATVEGTRYRFFPAQAPNDLFWTKMYLRRGKAKNKRPRMRPDMNKHRQSNNEPQGDEDYSKTMAKGTQLRTLKAEADSETHVPHMWSGTWIGTREGQDKIKQETEDMTI